MYIIEQNIDFNLNVYLNSDYIMKSKIKFL